MKHPDISHRNNFLSVKNAPLLQNGNRRNAILINKQYVLLQNSCSFDSIVQILATTGMDDPNYFSFMDASRNDTMKFVKKLIEKGSIPTIYRERTILLKSHFPEKMKIDDSIKCGLLPWIIDMWDSITIIWMKCFHSEPSGFINYSCSTCGNSTYPLKTISVNHKTITDEGFHKLLDALPTSIANSSCRICLNTCQTTTEYNRHLFIELDVRMNMSEYGKDCKLTEFPTFLNLNNVKYK